MPPALCVRWPPWRSSSLAHAQVVPPPLTPCAPRAAVGETANGAFPAEAVRTMAAIVTNAETANSYYR